MWDGDWADLGEAGVQCRSRTASELGSLRPTGPSSRSLPEQRGRVEESAIRGHPQLSRRLSPKFNFSLAAGAEYSQLSQVGAGGLTAISFVPKGTVNATWTAELKHDREFAAPAPPSVRSASSTSSTA
jgi:hypothetical protein